MITYDPNMLNAYALSDPHYSTLVCLIVSISSACLAFVISWAFYRSYKFSWFGYLLGLPTGFTLLGLSFVFHYLSLDFRLDDLLYPELSWIQFTLQSNGLALIAISYRYKLRNCNVNSLYRPYLETGIDDIDIYRVTLSDKAKNMAANSLFTGLILIPFIVPAFDLALNPYFDYAGIADLEFIMTIFNMLVIGYILKTVIVSFASKFNSKFIYPLAAFTLLWLEQYSLLLVYWDNGSVSFYHLNSSAIRRSNIISVSNIPCKVVCIEDSQQNWDKIKDTISNSFLKYSPLSRRTRFVPGQQSLLMYSITQDYRMIIWWITSRNWKREGMVHRDYNSLITITNKGQKYIKQYSELVTLIESVSL